MSKNTNEIQLDLEDKSNTFSKIFIKGQTYKNVLDKSEIWQELESEYKGKLDVIFTKSYDGTTLKLEIPYRNLQLYLIENDTMPLKAEFLLNISKEFEFSISLEDWTDKLAFLFGKKDIKTNEPEFNKKYRIKSNNNGGILQLLDERVRNLILKNDIYTLNLKKEKETNVSKLLIVKDRNTKEKNKLNDLIILSFTIIDNLINQRFLDTE